MRGGGNKAPPQALYRPGSGPLRKSGRPEDFDSQTIPQDKSKIYVQDHVKHAQHSSKICQSERVVEKLSNIRIDCKKNMNLDQIQSTSKANHLPFMDLRKKNKKPEQQLYVPKRGKESLTQQDIIPSRRNHNPLASNDQWQSKFPFDKNSVLQRENKVDVEFAYTKNTSYSNRSRENCNNEMYNEHYENNKFQRKPPLNKREGGGAGRDLNISKRNNRDKLDSLPPRFRKIQERKMLQSSNNSPINKIEDSWDGSTVTFQGHMTQQYNSYIPNSQPMPTPCIPVHTNWSNTVPARGRGRGRIRQKCENPSPFRSCNPEQISASSSRSHSPNHERNWSGELRGSNSTLYTSMESLSKNESKFMPPSLPPQPHHQSNKGRYFASESHKRDTYNSGMNYQINKVNDVPHRNSYDRETEDSKTHGLKEDSREEIDLTKTSNVESSKTTLNWCEEVDPCELLETEQMSRSSSAMSLPDNAHFTQDSLSHRLRKNRKKKSNRTYSQESRDNSRESQNNHYNREHVNYRNVYTEQDNDVSNGKGNRFENKHHINNNSSRDSSKEPKSHGNSRVDEFHRHRPEHSSEENWRSTKSNFKETSDLHRPPPTHFVQNLPSNIRFHQSTSHQPQPPRVLILPDHSHAQNITSHCNQQRILFDPNNPNKPILVPANRPISYFRNNENSGPLNICLSYVGHPPVPADAYYQKGVMHTAPLQHSDQYVNMGASWYGSNSESFRTTKNRTILLNIERNDLELQNLLTPENIITKWDKICEIRRAQEENLKVLLETDLKFCESENVEQHFWKIAYYNIIEILRKVMPVEHCEIREEYKKIMLNLIEDGTAYFSSLITILETTYKFKLDTYLTSSTAPTGLGMVGLALVSVQKILLFLGDLSRYREQVNQTSNYGKSRQEMRSLMASNPFHSARESLITMFDENRRKYESSERKRNEEKEWKEKERMIEKESANVGGGLRREIWIHPGGKVMRRTTTTATGPKLSNSDLEDLSELSSLELNKRFVTSYLHVHGKLITKIGMETFQSAVIQMLREFRTLLNVSPLPLPGNRLLQLLALNMFAIESTQLKEVSHGYKSELQEQALVVSLQMFNLILERANNLLSTQLESKETPRLIVDEDMQILLPAIKVWCDWMLCHSSIWNPPPFSTDYKVGSPGDVWSRLAIIVNLLEKLDYPRNLLVMGKDGEKREGDLKLIKLPEDTTLAGFTPLMSNPQDPVFANKKDDMEVVQVILRIHKILFFGQVFLCGLETPMLKLQKNENGPNEYVSVIERSNVTTPDSPPEQSDSELVVESYSENEEESGHSSSKDPVALDLEDYSHSTIVSSGEVRSLIEKREELEKKRKRHERHRQRVQAILQNSSLAVEIEVRPKYLVPDTNCFIDFLPQLINIGEATSSAQPIFTLTIPLVVMSELEGLSKGTNVKHSSFVSRRKLNPQRAAHVAEKAKAGLNFARNKNPAIKCVTTKGTILPSNSFTAEDDSYQEEMNLNDDKILSTCLSLSKSQNNDIDHMKEKLAE